jgi:hypothetical protein
LLLRLPQIPHDNIALMRGRNTHPKFKDVEWRANGISARSVGAVEVRDDGAGAQVLGLPEGAPCLGLAYYYAKGIG